MVLASFVQEIRLRSGVALSRHFDLDVGFFPNIFWPNFFNPLLRRMVLVGTHNSHHTLRGVVLILNQRICGAGGRNTPTEWL